MRVLCSALLLPRIMRPPIMRSSANAFAGLASPPLRLTGPPQIRMMASFGDKTVVDTCKGKITEALNPVDLKIQGAFDDPNGSHIAIYCVAEAFEGLRSMKRQQLVYKAIWQEMEGLPRALTHRQNHPPTPCPSPPALASRRADGGPLHAVDSMTLLAPSEVKS
eukprot:Transcript_13564.p1 GENE.Transcript_13564~~Transcript_13564.p1  ORF type:complete len:164 (-),score=39.62 Transcript_13564:77-568(-)